MRGRRGKRAGAIIGKRNKEGKMSIKQMTKVWELRDLTPTHKLILLGLADWANDEGLCWPSVDRLAQKTGLSRRTIQTNIRQLEACRYMKREEVVGRGNRYWLTLEDDPLPSDFEPIEGRRQMHPCRRCTRAGDAQGGRRSCTQYVNDTSEGYI
ncbi:hypothetical protein SXAG_00122 [Synechococcus phage S-CBS4]|nr:hypothetical protein SXAG_00122 [Synechococcus phage S-CBS4]